MTLIGSTVHHTDDTVGTVGTGGIADFETFVRERRGRLLQAAWLLTGDRASAEDLVQVTLEAVWKRWSDAGTIDHPAAYAHRALTNTFVSSRRRRWTGEAPTAELPERPGADQHGIAEQRLTLARALGRLPARQRAAVVLRYFHDLSEAETAAALDCAPGTVKSQLHKAIRTLRRDAALTDLLEEF